MPKKVMDLDVDEFQALIQQQEPAPEYVEGIVTKVFRQGMVEVGIDVDNAAEQRTDFFYLRRSRRVADKVTMGARMSFIGTLITATLYAIGQGIKAILTKGG